jgi:hypothetical protein
MNAPRQYVYTCDIIDMILFGSGEIWTIKAQYQAETATLMPLTDASPFDMVRGRLKG